MHKVDAISGAAMNAASGVIEGQGVICSVKVIGQLAGVFADEAARGAMSQDRRVYGVLAHLAVAEGTAGGLFFGTSFIEPGAVGDEFFMTRGHFHARIECGEYYWGIAGQGLLLLMTSDRQCRAEVVRAGSLHYIPGHTAHRLVNTGSEQLAVGACWPSDAGHDYASIDRAGFSVRVLRDGSSSLGYRLVEVG